MGCRIVGWPADEPRLELDHRQFAYAGKFVMTSTGKAVFEDDGEILAAVSFSADRTDSSIWWIRIVTVRRDRRGEGLGPELLAFTGDRLLDRAGAVRIGVNNPFAYEAAYKAGFGFTETETGLRELVLERPGDRSTASYRAGLERFLEREDLEPPAVQFIEDREANGVPRLVGREQ